MLIPIETMAKFYDTPSKLLYEQRGFEFFPKSEATRDMWQITPKKPNVDIEKDIPDIVRYLGDVIISVDKDGVYAVICDNGGV